MPAVLFCSTLQLHVSNWRYRPQRRNSTITFFNLFGHYNLLQFLASATRAVAAWRQFRIPSVLRFSWTCLVQRWGGRPWLRHLPPGSDSKTLRTGLELSIPATWPSHRRHCILMSSYISKKAHLRSKTPNACENIYSYNSEHQLEILPMSL